VVNIAAKIDRYCCENNAGALVIQEEGAQLIDTAPTPSYRTILMTLYGTGVRRTELTRLKVSDIDFAEF
jgi:integrase